MPLTVTIDDSNLRLRLASMPENVRRALTRAVTVSAIDMQAKVMAKLAGPVLNERTHHLHDSIHYQVDDSAAGVTATVGTNVVYARIHEHGGDVTVRAHMMKMTQEFGRPITPREVLVRAHVAHYPKRSFLRSTLAENAAAIQRRLETAVRGAVGESP
jgi:phage gpG-like protein